MKKKGIIIGFGGMGIRHLKALTSLGIQVIAICDKNIDKLNNLKLSNVKKVSNYKNLLNLDADIVCISSNTKSRENIIKDFLIKSSINKILIEKPLAVSFSKCLELYKISKKLKKRKRIFVNTFRTISPNFKRIKKFFKSQNEKVTQVFINSPSAGLGNMGSIFFDLSNYFINDKPISVSSWIDQTGTISPRGKQFKDPGGYGVIRYKNYKKVFFDLSENTSLPYKILIKSRNMQFTIDEINNKYHLEERPDKLRRKPDYFYLYKPTLLKLKKTEKYDVVKMTKLSIKTLFKSSGFKSNMKESVEAMQLVFSCHASKFQSGIINIPLKKRYHNLKVNFP